MAESPLLSLRDVSLAYGAIRALDKVSLNVPKGAIVSLLGGNGAGKTSTLSAISGLHPLSCGEILFEGERISGRSPHNVVERGICHVPEGRLVFANLSVDENLAMGAYLDRDMQRKVHNRDYVYSMFPRLKERARQLAGTLSGGEQQMLAIGRALMGNPRLLMLDEPSLGIAPRLVTTIFEKITAINREQGLSILLVEQNAHLSLEISSWAYVLESGKIVIQGPSAMLKNDPALKAAYLGG